MSTQDIDDLFTAARATPPAPSAALLARVMEDALTHQPTANVVHVVPRRNSLWSMLSTAFGGRTALAGLSVAALAGFWLGFAQPAPVAAPVFALTDALWSGTPLDTVELIPGFDDFLTEG